MVTPLDAVNVVLLAAGAVIMGRTAKQARSIARMKRVSPDMRTWQVVRPLTWGLVVAAVLAILAVVLDFDAVFATIVSLLCIAGAYHIHLVVTTSKKTLGAFVETSLSQRQIGDVLDSLGDAVLLVDSLGIVRTVNRKLCELSSYPANALVGKPIAQTLGLELPRNNILTSTTFDLPFLADQEMRRRGGGTLSVSVGLVAAQGNVVCVIKDTREERQRQRQLDDAVQIAEQVLHTHNDFMTLLALELKDPLSILRQACRAVLDAPPGTDLVPLAQLVADNHDELERVILDLFALGRTGGSAEDARMLYPAALVRDVVEVLAGNAARMGTEVRHWVDPETPTTFYGRDIQIRQILALLGSFALNRSAGGEVRLAVGPVPGDDSASQLLFSVRDTGPALSDSVMNLDFTPLDRSAERSTAQFDLAIARLLVLSLGGKMTASNTAGRTATIYFTVPGVPASAAVAAPDPRQSSSRFRRPEVDASLRLAKLALPEAQDPSAQDPQRGAVLIVDANEATRNLLAHQIQRAGYTVKTAGTGKEALELAWQEKLDVILLDVMLPDRDGISVLEALQKQGTLENVSVLMTSAVDEKTSIAACIERGAEDFLPKPIHPAILRARLGVCLEKKTLRDRTKQHLEQLATESRRSNELLRVLFPDAIADELQATGAIAPRRHEMIAVMFADLVGFTEYCDQHSPEEVLVILQELFTRFEALAAEFNVQKIKTIGDSFMGAAGLFVPEERPALRCVAFGEAMLGAIRETTTRWALRIGVHVGPVVGGVVGNQRYLYDIWGDTVNTAQRIEHGGRSGMICVSAAARAQIEPNRQTRSLGVTGIKGKGELELFEVLPAERGE